jgi:hypothetical protein
MITFRAFALNLLLLIASSAYGQKAAHQTTQKPLETTLCKVLDNPAAFDGKLVKVRGYLAFWEEGSVLRDDDNCPQDIWFVGFGDVILPEIVAIVPGRRDKASGRQAGPVTRVVRDSNFEEFARYMNHNAKAQQCFDGPPPDFDHLSDCMTYRITATFTGRIDGVSKQVHQAHLKRKFGEPTDWKGFGHMGAYDAQIAVQSVESVVAVDEYEARHVHSNSQQDRPRVSICGPRSW